MDDDRRTRIRNALQHYRDTVLNHNMVLLEAIITHLEAQADPPRCSHSTKNKLCIRPLDRYIGSNPNLSTQLTSLRDVLASPFRDELVQQAYMQGVSLPPGDERERKEYFRGLRVGLPERLGVLCFHRGIWSIHGVLLGVFLGRSFRLGAGIGSSYLRLRRMQEVRGM